MPETDVLNPSPLWESDVEDSMCPNYGFTRKRGLTQLRTKAVGGTPWTRETQNTGHSFPLTWLTRSFACVQRLKWYFEQYEDGYFTVIDHDGGGRNYVGRFTGSEFPMTEDGNDMWSVQNLLFEEMPRAPMIEYPSDWNHDSILFGVANDFGDQKLASNGSWTQAAATAPAITLGGLARGAGSSLALPAILMTNPGTTEGDWATFEYRGYGFQLWMQTGPAQGKCELYIDGVLDSTIDCYAAAAAIAMVASRPNLALDIHDVQVLIDSTKNGSSSAPAIGWYGLQVMR